MMDVDDYEASAIIDGYRGMDEIAVFSGSNAYCVAPLQHRHRRRRRSYSVGIVAASALASPKLLRANNAVIKANHLETWQKLSRKAGNNVTCFHMYSGPRTSGLSEPDLGGLALESLPEKKKALLLIHHPDKAQGRPEKAKGATSSISVDLIARAFRSCSHTPSW